MTFRILKLLLLLIATTALVVMAMLAAIYLPGLHRAGARTNPVAQDFSRTDFITIILAAASLMLAALGLVLAAAGAVGYVTVRVAAERAAETAAKEAGIGHAEVVATRLVRELLPQLMAGSRQGSSEGDAFAEAEGDK